MKTIHFLSLLLIFILLIFVVSCNKRESQITNGKILTNIEVSNIRSGYTGDSIYAVVNSNSLQSFYDNFRDVLSKQGLVKWDARFDCNHFSSLYIALAQSKYTVAAWNSSTPAQSLAMAEIWYNKDGIKNNGHAVVLIITENGPIYIEPQTGQQIQLSDVEKNSIFFCKW